MADETISVNIRNADGTLRRVRAWKTRSPHFVVNRRTGLKFGPQSPFVVTHLPTGGSLFPAYSVRGGQLIAAVTAALPVKWDKVTITNYAEMYRRLDKVWSKWAHALQFETPAKPKAKRSAA